MSHWAGDYAEIIKKRKKESRVYKKYQLTGLEIAELLHDDKHKALYMKLARKNDSDALLVLAKEIARKKNIQNKGAYFMSCLAKKKHGA